MTNEPIVRQLIRGSIQRAVLESVAAAFVAVWFGWILSGTPADTPGFFGCLLIVLGAGFVAGVVWSHALSYRLLESHPADDGGFWSEAFQAQARLLRRAPWWYCGPYCVGAVLLVLPSAVSELLALSLVALIMLMVMTAVVWLNRRAAACLDDTAATLTR